MVGLGDAPIERDSITINGCESVTELGLDLGSGASLLACHQRARQSINYLGGIYRDRWEASL